MQTTTQTVWKCCAGAIVTAAVLFLVWYFSSVVIYILVSAVLAVIGRPLVKRLSRLHVGWRRLPRSLAALLTLLLIWAVAAVCCALFVPLVFHQVRLLTTVDFSAAIAGLEEPIYRLQTLINETLAIPPDQQHPLVESLAGWLREQIHLQEVAPIFSSIAGFLFSTVIAVLSVSFITFFFLRDDGLFYSMVAALFPERYHDNITRALDSVTLLLSRYFSGILSESLLLMCAVLAVMMLFGMKASDACFIGLIMGVMNVVPYAGPFIGGVLAVFMGLVTPIEGMTAGQTAAVIACSLLVLKGLDDFVLQPTLYSERVKAHPLEVFLVILLAGSIAGILGMLLAIPSYTVLRVFAKEFFSQFRLVRKLTEKI